MEKLVFTNWAQVLYIPIYKQPYYKNNPNVINFKIHDFKTLRFITIAVFSISIYYDLKFSDQNTLKYYK